MLQTATARRVRLGYALILANLYFDMALNLRRFVRKAFLDRPLYISQISKSTVLSKHVTLMSSKILPCV